MSDLNFSTILKDTDIKIDNFEYQDMELVINKNEFKELNVVWYLYFSFLRIVSHKEDKEKVASLENKFKSVFGRITEDEKKVFLSYFIKKISVDVIKDDNNMTLFNKYIAKTSLELKDFRIKLFNQELNESKENIVQSFSSPSKIEDIFEYIDDFASQNNFDDKKITLFFQSLVDAGLFINLNFKPHDIDKLFEENNITDELFKAFEYSNIFQLDLMFINTNNGSSDNLDKIAPCYKKAFERILERVDKEDASLYQYRIHVNAYHLFYLFSEMEAESKKKLFMKHFNRMLESKAEVFYENDLIRMFQSLVNVNHITSEDIRNSSLPSMVESLIIEKETENEMILTFDLVKMKRIMMLNEIIYDKALNKELFGHLSLFLRKDIHTLLSESGMRRFKNERKNVLYGKITNNLLKKCNVFQEVDDMLIRKLNLMTASKKVIKSKELLNINVVQDTRFELVLNFILKKEADKDFFKNIIYSISAENEDNIPSKLELMINEHIMKKEANKKPMIEKKIKVNKF